MSDEARGQWLPTSQAAAALGVSERTVQRRATNGKIEARKVTDDDGERWEVLVGVPPGAAIVPPTVPTGAATSSEREIAPEAPERDNSGGTVPPGAAIVPPPETRPEMEAEMRAQLEREREQVMFLRGLVEQRDRDAAELRASLREALRAMPKQLGAGDVSAVQQPTPTDPPKRAKSATMNDDGPAPTTGAQRPNNRRGDGLALVRDGLKRLFGR
jgi:hypothetical protein